MIRKHVLPDFNSFKIVEVLHGPECGLYWLVFRGPDNECSVDVGECSVYAKLGKPRPLGHYRTFVDLFCW